MTDSELHVHLALHSHELLLDELRDQGAITKYAYTALRAFVEHAATGKPRELCVYARGVHGNVDADATASVFDRAWSGAEKARGHVTHAAGSCPECPESGV